MKSLIIYHSIHHGNTGKVALAISEVMGSDIVKIDNAEPEMILKYDLIGFGSGIYFSKHSKKLLEFCTSLSNTEAKNAFIFSTRGLGPFKVFHRPLRKILYRNGFNIIDEFSCKGFDTVGPLNIIGGINKNRPNEKDLKKAIDFALNLLQNVRHRTSV